MHRPRNLKIRVRTSIGFALMLILWLNGLCLAGLNPARRATSKPTTKPATSSRVDLLRAHAKTEANSSTASATAAAEKSRQASAQLDESYGKLPLRFEMNKGQTDEQVKFISRGRGYTMFLTPREAVMVLENSAAPRTGNLVRQPSQARKPATKSAILRMSLVGASARPNVTGETELPGKSNYFIGADSSRWQTSVSNYGQVRYESVYPGIDMLYYGNNRQLETDFLLAPGADFKRIRLNFEGAKRLHIEAGGDLVLSLKQGEVRQRRPFAYQEINGQRIEVASRYTLIGKKQVGFELGAYDSSRPLVIDPVLEYSTYLGGGGNDIGNAIAIDAAGNTYVSGVTASTNFPVASAKQATNRGLNDVFITKLNATGSTILYSTYLGGIVDSRVAGSGDDNAAGIAVDSSGNAYVAGSTTSADYPITTGALRTTAPGGTSDGFVSKLGPTGATLVYSTYLGGSTVDSCSDIAIDSSGNAYLTGSTDSTNFPLTAGAFSTTLSGLRDVFVSKLNPTGTALVYSTFVGGSANDSGNAIALDSAGNAYVTGDTVSMNYPTINAVQGQLSGQERFGPSIDAIVTKLNPSGTALVYSTYLGGNVPKPDAFGVYSASDSGRGIAVDSSGSAYITGGTGSTDFPVTNAFQYYNTSYSSTSFVAKFSPSGSSLLYSTYLGGSSPTSLMDIDIDASGSAYVAGYTLSNDYPTTNAIQPNLRTSTSGGVDAVVTKLSPEGYSLEYSTYLGGGAEDRVNSVAVDASGNAYLTGFTFSTDFPTGGAAQATNAGGQDVFIAKITNVNGYSISGRVTTVGGASSVNGATVTLSGGQNATTITDASGFYVFYNLPPGRTYTVTPSLPPYRFLPSSQTISNLSSNQTADFQIATYSISGRVTDASGASLPDTTISLGGSQTATALTDANGNYSFINLAQSGNYTVTPSKSDVLLTYNFTPPSYSFNDLGANQTANFTGSTSLTGRLNPIADAYVQDGTNAAVNFGTASTLRVQTGSKAGSGLNSDSYLKFNLSGLSRNITSAKLRVYASLSAAGSVATSVHSVADINWIESGTNSINWNNKPARSATALTGATATVTSTTPAFFDIDVTAYVKSEKLAGRDTVSLALHNAAASTVVINLNSREAATNKPQLIVATNHSTNNPPAVSLTAPATGASYTAPASITLNANATDSDGSIGRVEFYAGTVLIGTATTPVSGSTYSFTWANVAAGAYSLYAVAVDNVGAATSGNVANVSVNVPNNPPSVSVTSPVGGALFSAGSNINISANAADTDGTISKVEFFAGTTLVGTATTPVQGIYSVAWNSVPAGAYALTAKATDNSGGTTTSSAVNINVVGQTGLSPTADAYVKDGTTATTNFGTATELQTQVAMGANRETYLKFDTTATTGVARAQIRLYGRLSDLSVGNIPAGVFPVALTTWIESGSGSITWNTKPVAGTSALSTTTITENVARWYEWDVTAYVQAEKVAGRHVVSFAVKNTTASGNFATFNSREATANQPQLVLWATQPRNVLLVIGSTTLNAGDNAVKTRLQNLGFTVTVKAAGSTTSTSVKNTDADGKALVVISSTVTPANVAAKLRNIPVPVLVWEFDLLDDMGMTGLTSGTDFGTTAGLSQLTIASPGHPMAAGLTGTIPVLNTGATSNFNWGKPNANAARIATLTTDATRYVIFGYDNGATMPGLDAPARRVAVFLSDTTAGSLNTNGGALFDTAVKWATDISTAPLISSLSPNSGPFGTSVTINGFNFGATQSGSMLTFNGAPAAPASWADKKIVVVVPTYATTGAVVVTVNGVSSNGVVFSVGATDSDGDGLPDSWELQYFGNLNQGPAGDPDGDGVANLQEFQSGQNPTRPGLPDNNGAVNLKLKTPLDSPPQ
jgi:Bacterial Ig domain/IPT/TIG domain/Beta-propeller repeat/Carboxypeptidase regulatory-like domain